MYYVIDYLTNPSVEDDDDGPFLEIHEELVKRPEPINWHMGKRFDIEVTVPIEVPVSPRFDYDGPPPDFLTALSVFYLQGSLKFYKITV